jgi:hypothetical protein
MHTTARTSADPEAKPSGGGGFWLPLGLGLAGAAAYANSLAVPLLFDDDSSIATNDSLRHLGAVFWPPGGTTVGGRPFLNLTLALDYAVSGTGVWSYHATNVAIHLLAGLTLYGLVRRTLAPRAAGAAAGIAFCAALLWMLHPLQTESVTYVIQRAESLMGLLYLLTLYCFRRGAEARGRAASRWFALAATACLLGMATKEVMVSAPLVVFLYDRTFLAGTFREAWRRRQSAYWSLAATWLLLAGLVVLNHGRGGTAGFSGRLPVARYALTQFVAIVHYLRLCFWPHPLVFSYGSTLVLAPGRIGLAAAAVAGLLAATGWALVRRPALGFLGFGFFAILAPSSSVVPIATETMAEQRMYLPLAAVAVLVAIGIHRGAGRWALPCCLVLAAALGGATLQRNRDYANPLRLWGETVAECPDNFFARYDYGSELAKIPGRSAEAIAQFEAAIRLNPDLAEAHFYLASLLQQEPGRLPEAAAHYEEVLRLSPDDFKAHTNLGNILVLQGKAPEAIAHYRAALRLNPNLAEVHFDLALVLLGTPGGTPEAIEHLKAGLRLQPGEDRARRILAQVTGSQP